MGKSLGNSNCKRGKMNLALILWLLALHLCLVFIELKAREDHQIPLWGLLPHAHYWIFPNNSCFQPATTSKKGHGLTAMVSALLCYFQSRVLVRDILVQENAVPNLLLVLFYFTVFYVTIIFWCSHWWHLRWEQTRVLPFRRCLFSDWWGPGRHRLVFPHLPCRWPGSLSKMQACTTQADFSQ